MKIEPARFYRKEENSFLSQVRTIKDEPIAKGKEKEFLKGKKVYATIKGEDGAVYMFYKNIAKAY